MFPQVTWDDLDEGEVTVPTVETGEVEDAAGGVLAAGEPVALTGPCY